MALKVKDIEKQLIATRGNFAAVGRALGVSRQAISKRVSESPQLQAVAEEARERMLDDAENVLYEEALTGNMTALIFYLKTQGKRRGYTERQEITGADGNDLTIKLTWGDNAESDA